MQNRALSNEPGFVFAGFVFAGFVFAGVACAGSVCAGSVPAQIGHRPILRPIPRGCQEVKPCDCNAVYSTNRNFTTLAQSFRTEEI
jgi:hypothetical protein